MRGRVKDSIETRKRKQRVYQEIQRKGFELKNKAAKLFKVKSRRFTAKDGKRDIVYIRAMITRVLSNGGQARLIDIKDVFNVNHTSIVYYRKVFDEQIKYEDFRANYELLKSAI